MRDSAWAAGKRADGCKRRVSPPAKRRGRRKAKGKKKVAIETIRQGGGNLIYLFFVIIYFAFISPKNIIC